MSSANKNFTFRDLVDSVENFPGYAGDIKDDSYFGFPAGPILDIETALRDPAKKSAVYFSMEFGLAPSIYNCFQLSRPISEKNQYFTHEVFSNYWLCDYLFKIKIDRMLDIPIYGGGLGVLAGDAMKSAADLSYPIVGIGVLWNKGYFKQNFWYKHGQVPEELKWDPATYPGLIPLKNIVQLDTKDGPLYLRLWKYYVYSYDKTQVCPLVLLDSNLSQNKPEFQKLTDQLYRSDNVWWKIFQRAILGLGGMKALESLGYSVNCYHLNEGHAAFAILEKYVNLQDKSRMDQFKDQFVFTCHTPVAAGHDRFFIRDVQKILSDEYVDAAQKFGKESSGSDQINLTYLCLSFCNKVNAVSMKHGEVMRLQFPDFAPKVQSITNGVHTHTWVSESFQKLFNSYPDVFGDWKRDPENLVHARKLIKDSDFRRKIFEAHQVNKRNLIELAQHWRLKDNILTIGWARRIAGYKRPSLIFHNIQRIIDLAHQVGPLQIILAGKAHPNDDIGAAHIEEILDHIDELNGHKDVIRVLIFENYDTYFGKLLTNSVDVWLNNPLPPFEASGTSGMKAIQNGVLQLSTLDGWVVEAADDDIGWIFGYQHKGTDLGRETSARLEGDSKALGDALEVVMHLYYQTIRPEGINVESAWIDKMIHCVERSAFFSTQRMLKQYNEKMWHF